MKKCVSICSRSLLEFILMGTMMISFLAGTVLVGLSMYVVRNLANLVETYLDPAVRRLNLTKTLLARYGAIVPNKDYIPLEVDLGPWLPWLPGKAFKMGVILVVFSLFGIYAAAAGRRTLLYMLIGLLSLALVGQLFFVVSVMDIRSQMHRSLRKGLFTEMQSRYEFGAETHDPFSFVLNSIMLMGECCGVNGPRDFTRTNHSYIHASGSGNRSLTHNATVLFPLACCHRYYIEKGFHKTLDCALSWSSEKINRIGCYQTLHVYFSNHYGPTVMGIYFGITYVEVFQIFMAWLLIGELKKEKDTDKRCSQKPACLSQPKWTRGGQPNHQFAPAAAAADVAVVTNV